MDFVLVLMYGCGVDTGSTTNSVSETWVLAETEASNSRAWVAVTLGDNTGGGPFCSGP